MIMIKHSTRLARIVLPYVLMLLGHTCITILAPTTALISLLFAAVVGGLLAMYLLRSINFSLSAGNFEWIFFSLVASAPLVSCAFAAFLGNSSAFIKTTECLVPCFWGGIFALYFLSVRSETDQVCRFLAFFAVAFFGFATCLAIWHIGAREYALLHPNHDRFPYTFDVWEGASFSKHWFLIFDMRNERFEDGKCYHGYSPWFAFTYYIPLKVIKNLYGIGYAQGIRYMPLIHGFMLSLVLAAFFAGSFACNYLKRISYVASMVVGTVLILSISDFWTGPIRMDGECSFPIIIMLQCVTTALVFRGDFERVAKWRYIYYASIIAFALLVPIHAALFAMALFMLGLAKPRTEYFYGAGIMLGVALLTYSAAYLAAYLAGLSVSGSPFLARSGLDGNTQYFDNIVQAFWSPRIQNQFRVYSFVKFGFTAWVFATIGQFFCSRSSRIGHAVWLLFGSVLLDVIVFPQAHSTHPYFYDITVAAVGVLSLMVVWMELQQQEGNSLERWHPLLVSILGAFILNNFLVLIRFFKTPI